MRRDARAGAPPLADALTEALELEELLAARLEERRAEARRILDEARARVREHRHELEERKREAIERLGHQLRVQHEARAVQIERWARTAEERLRGVPREDVNALADWLVDTLRGEPGEEEGP